MTFQYSIASKITCLSNVCALALLAGCATALQTNSLAALGVGVLGASPSTNIGQTYYLGVFDPHEQLPPTIYRLRVQGQASVLSGTKFASGWVRADLVDSLSGQIEIGKNGITEENKSQERYEDNKNALNRRLIMFGPEGFREAPKNHRLVIVMGSSPDAFFGSVDRALGVVAEATQGTSSSSDMTRVMWSELSHLREEKRAVQTLLDLSSAK